MISLSLKYAGMLATEELQQIKKCLADDKKVLAPLAGAVFSKDCIKEIARDRGISHEETVNMINASCEGGGHQLYSSDGNVAIVAALCASRGIKDYNQRTNLVTKTFKQYASIGKRPDLDGIKFYSKFATGGMPPDMTLKSMVEIMETAQQEYSVTLRQQMQASMVQARSQVGQPVTREVRGDRR